jgi:SAM-dependent methyltransferase
LNGNVVSPLRVEIGGGPFPSPGYVHVDGDRRARHVEYLAPAWELPFADGSVEEILAIHVLEHVHPALTSRTLGEWRRALRPGGVVQIHVPNAAAILAAYLHGDVRTKWFAMSAIFGTPCGPEWTNPADLDGRASWTEHQALYDVELLTDVVSQAGFTEIEDITDDVSDRHDEGWADVIPRLSLKVRAVAPNS